MTSPSDYALRKGSTHSLWGAMENDGLGNMFQRTLRSIPSPDISDVAYDYFLANTSVPLPQIYTMFDFGKLPSPYLPGNKMKGKPTVEQAGR